MAQNILKNPFRPAPGSSIKVDPIRDIKAIKHIKKNIEHNPRDLCLFTLGINTAYRANELLSIKVGQVRHLQPGDRLDLKQSKSGKYRATTLNKTVIIAIRGWLDFHPNIEPEAPLFLSQRGGIALGVPAVNHLVKGWCNDINLPENYGSHTLRKTWGYHQRILKETPVALLMVAYGHTTEAQTLAYLGIQADEIRKLYDMEL